MLKMVTNPMEANLITHSGTMHADEVFATAFLELYLKEVKVLRTSEVPKNVPYEAIIYDIGRGKFDHHQPDAKKRENGIPYSSIGLLWEKFGRDYLEKQKIENKEEVFLGVDKDLIEAIDADDNGYFPKIDATYKVKTLSNIIKIFNPSYDSKETETNQFQKAVGVAKIILEEEIIYITGKVKADKIIKKELEKVEEDDKYLILEEYLPYEEALLNSEKGNNLLFVAFPSNRGGYAIKTIPKSLTDKTARLLFKEEWAGKTEEELEEVSGIKGLRFCHTGRFILTCDTKETVEKVLDLLCKENVNEQKIKKE